MNEGFNVLFLVFCRWHRELLLRPGASHETASYPNDSQPAAELRTVQKDGDLCVFLKNYHIRPLLLESLFFPPLFNVSLLSVLHFRGHTRRRPRRWRSTTVTTTSSSCGPYGRTTFLSSASRCSAVSLIFEQMSCLFQTTCEESLFLPLTNAEHLDCTEAAEAVNHTRHIYCCVVKAVATLANNFAWINNLHWMHQMVNSVSQCWYLYLIPLFHSVTNKYSVITQWHL